MSLRHIVNGFTLLLFILCSVLAVFIIKQWEDYNPRLQAEGLVAEDIESALGDKTQLLRGQSKMIQMSQFSEILARPLFTEGRLPNEEPKGEGEVNQSVGQPKVKLEGVVISPDTRVAVLRDQTNNELIRLAVGMIHTGWRLSSVEDEEVVFERGEETFSAPLELINKPVQKASTSRFRVPNKNKKATPAPRPNVNKTK